MSVGVEMSAGVDLTYCVILSVGIYLSVGKNLYRQDYRRQLLSVDKVLRQH